MTAHDALTVLGWWWLLGFFCTWLYVATWSFADCLAHRYPLRACFRIAVKVASVSVFTINGILAAFAGPLTIFFLAWQQTNGRKP